VKWKDARRLIDIDKNSRYALIINSLQIVMTLTIVLVVLVSPYYLEQLNVTRLIVAAAAALVLWGAVVDIREALAARRTLRQMQSLEDSLRNIEALHHTLRAQRHDFLNHLQVVYSLMEMEEYADANGYIEKVYGSISAVSRSLKTKNTAVNALLRVKVAAVEKLGIGCELNIASAWEDMPVPGWEMCRVLSNLIDNAVDAIGGDESKRVSLSLGENLKQYTFRVANDGPPIPPEFLANIFAPGVTSKSEGRGMGLFIVKNIMQTYGGDIEVSSDAAETAFYGYIPKTARATVEDELVTNQKKS